MLFDLIVKTPEFANNAISFFTSYILLPFIGIVAGFSFVIFVYGYIKYNHLGDYYTSGEDEGKALMWQGLLFLGICAGIFVLAYFFLA